MQLCAVANEVTGSEAGQYANAISPGHLHKVDQVRVSIPEEMLLLFPECTANIFSYIHVKQSQHLLQIVAPKI